MTKLMVVVAAAMLAAICHGSAVYYGAQDTRNVDCSYAQTVMHMAEEGKVKLTEGEKRMIQVARVHCSRFATSSYEEDVLIRQADPSNPPTDPPGCEPADCPPTTRPPTTRPSTTPTPTARPRPPFPFFPRPLCSCKCSDEAWAERECKHLAPGCIVTKMGCPHGKFMCCGIAH